VTGHARRMAATYSTGTFARIVAAGGRPGFMNLGFACDPLRPGSTASRQHRLARMVCDAVGPGPGQWIIDVGCGKGGMASLLHATEPAARVIGVNIDRHQLVTARSRAPQADWAVGDAVRLPFGDATFDTLLAVELLSHVPEKSRLAEEFARVLLPGGRAVVALIALNRPLADFPRSARAHLARAAHLFAEDPGDIPTYDAAVSVFARAGLAIERSVDLSDGVFAARHEALRRLLRGLTGNALGRIGTRAVVRWRWHLDPTEFVAFLRTSTASHPCRYYEYHLLTLRKASGEANRT
jgi:SAM-dependent methyltransferase